MQHRVQLDMSFPTSEGAMAMMAVVKAQMAHAAVVVDKDGDRDGGYCQYHLCYHDEVPRKPCEVVERLEVAAVITPAKVVIGDATR